MTAASARLACALALALLSLGACEKGKPRHPPVDPMAVAPPPPGAPGPPTTGVSAGLPKRPEAPAFSIDRIADAPDPINRQPAIAPAGQPIVVQGFGLDGVAKAPGKGLDLVIDDKVFGTVYGGPRPDVAAYFKAPGLTAVGFTTTIPAGALAVGPHTAMVRVVAADGKGYFDGRKIPFVVK